MHYKNSDFIGKRSLWHHSVDSGESDLSPATMVDAVHRTERSRHCETHSKCRSWPPFDGSYPPHSSVHLIRPCRFVPSPDAMQRTRFYRPSGPHCESKCEKLGILGRRTRACRILQKKMVNVPHRFGSSIDGRFGHPVCIRTAAGIFLNRCH